MDYFKVNYDKLQNMHQVKYFKIVIFIIVIISILLIVSSYIKIYKKIECVGIYNNGNVSLKINTKLSDSLKKSNFITFNNIKTNFKIKTYGNYEIINNDVFQEILLIVDEEFYDNEIGNIKFYYDKKSILENILDLFK